MLKTVVLLHISVEINAFGLGFLIRNEKNSIYLKQTLFYECKKAQADKSFHSFKTLKAEPALHG